jgi:hypothetical protein
VEYSYAPDAGVVEGPGGLRSGPEGGFEGCARECFLEEALAGCRQETAVPPVGLAFLAQESNEEAKLEDLKGLGLGGFHCQSAVRNVGRSRVDVALADPKIAGFVSIPSIAQNSD